MRQIVAGCATCGMMMQRPRQANLRTRDVDSRQPLLIRSCSQQDKECTRTHDRCYWTSSLSSEWTYPGHDSANLPVRSPCGRGLQQPGETKLIFAKGYWIKFTARSSTNIQWIVYFYLEFEKSPLLHTHTHCGDMEENYSKNLCCECVVDSL